MVRCHCTLPAPAKTPVLHLTAPLTRRRTSRTWEGQILSAARGCNKCGTGALNICRLAVREALAVTRGVPRGGWRGHLHVDRSTREFEKPGSAKGVMFITLEDETDVANLVVWTRTFEANCRRCSASR